MGRRELPIDNRASQPLRELAQWLRDQRKGIPYRVLAERTDLNATTLSRAASGALLPRRAVVAAFAKACGASPDPALALWKRARREERRALRGPALSAPRPHLIRDFADLAAALAELYEDAGAPPYRELEKAGPYGVLPVSTARRITRKEALPRTQEQLVAFLEGCGVPARRHKEWIEAWERARYLHAAMTEAAESDIPGMQDVIGAVEGEIPDLNHLWPDGIRSGDFDPARLQEKLAVLLDVLARRLPARAKHIPGMDMNHIRLVQAGRKRLSPELIERIVLLSIPDDLTLQSTMRSVLHRAYRALSLSYLPRRIGVSESEPAAQQLSLPSPDSGAASLARVWHGTGTGRTGRYMETLAAPLTPSETGDILI